MATNFDPSVSVWLQRRFLLSPSHENQANIIEAINSTFRYLDGLLNMVNEYFEQIVDTIYPKDLVI